MLQLEKQILELEKNITVLQKNNETLANSLALCLVGEDVFVSILRSDGVEQNKLFDIKDFYVKYIKFFKGALKEKYLFKATDIKSNTF